MNKDNDTTNAQQPMPETPIVPRLHGPVEAGLAFHDCVDYPHLPCPSCIHIAREEAALKTQG
jgi:hypothetical protein